MKSKALNRHVLLFVTLLCIVSGTASAQLADSLKSALLSDWQRAKSYTLEVLEAMPRNQYTFHPTDSTRTFASQMLHLARMNFLMISFGTGEKSAWMQRNIEKSATLTAPDSVKFVVGESYDFAIQSIRQLDPRRLLERNKIGPYDLPRFVWLMKAFEHQTHHRGQTVVYLRLCGVIPPEEKLL